jgi:putative SOS response-associated peptidase YedK
MCNRYRNKRFGWTDWTEDFSDLKIPLRFPDPLPNLREEIRPTNDAPIFRPIDANNPGAGLEAAVMRWDLVPFFWKQPIKAKKFLTTNARSETVATTSAFKGAFGHRRCLIPSDGFFEWTGQAGHKIKWLFTAADQPWFCFAGLWDHAETADGAVDSFTMLTTSAGQDMRPYHDRQPVILQREQWTCWLDLKADPSPLYAPGAAGTLNVELAPPEPRGVRTDA